MFSIIKFLSYDESAAAAVEYGMLLAFVALAALFGLTRVGSHLDQLFDRLRHDLERH